MYIYIVSGFRVGLLYTCCNTLEDDALIFFLDSRRSSFTPLSCEAYLAIHCHRGMTPRSGARLDSSFPTTGTFLGLHTDTYELDS
jgi:hypothetical protein